MSESTQNDAPEDMPLKCAKHATHHNDMFLEAIEGTFPPIVQRREDC